ncbi:MAG TPA: hypothetical protein DEF05_04045 [Erwinia sp.]|uniref:hypothetical protein n=1 Tax=Erwinia citreus TaxID=558 RepID=UPI000E98BBD3|nr:hypothetical protein [Erwinia sp.]HBV38870.1 hypothetical protein [Erwinia sp.]
MKRFSVVTFCLLLFSSVIFSVKSFASSQKEITGVLQAYWLPQWTEEGKAKPPLIIMRFFETGGKDNQTYYFYDLKEKGGVKDYFKTEETENFIRSNFKNTPEDFFRFKEGHTEQAGVVALSERTIIVECDNKQNYAKFNAFKPVQVNRFDINKLESASGCDPEPYSVMFTIKEGHDDIFLKSKPSTTSQNVVSKPISQPLVRIKTIDDQWVKVALYDASLPGSRSKTEGYVKFSDLDVVN